jgi:hypothetical protein
MSIALIGTSTAAAQLLSIPQKLRTAIEQKAVIAANKMIAGQMRQNAPQDTGALQKSIGYVVRKYQSGRIVFGAVGAKTGTGFYVSENLRGKKTLKTKKPPGGGQRVIPSKYLHLVIGSTVQRQNKAGANRGSVTANNFIETTRQQVEPQIISVFENAVSAALQ